MPSKLLSPIVAVLAMLFACCTQVALAQSPYPFVPANFEPPETMTQETYRMRMLSVADVIKDYDAVMSSEAYIKVLWDNVSWPTGLTIEQNLVDLGWHQKEFQRKRSFAYTITDLEDDRILGAVYINPTRKVGHDAVIYLWTRPADQTDLVAPDMVREDVRAWLQKAWPFKNPVFPGEDMPWDDWDALEETKR